MSPLASALRRWIIPVFQGRRIKLRAAWGLPGGGTGELPDRFFDLARERTTSPSVDDRTWADLEFPRIFALLNTTVTPIGGSAARLLERVGFPARIIEEAMRLANRSPEHRGSRSSVPEDREISRIRQVIPLPERRGARDD